MIYQTISPTVTVMIILLGIWTVIWKGIALYKSAKKNQNFWFIAMLILNTAGILPIIYLIMHKEK